MNILALDLGTRTGWALWDGQIISSGHIDFKNGRFEGGGMRYLKFKQWLNQVYTNAGEIGAVYFEEVRRHAGTDAAHVYGGFMAHLTAWCESRNIPYSGIPVGTIKRSATGKGSASKEAMIIAASSAVSRDISDDNEADAVCLLNFAIKGE